jgi:hypothetical protein
MIYRRDEGSILRNGINWSRCYATKFAIVIKIWRLIFGFRWRSKNVGGRRIVPYLHWSRRMGAMGRFCFDFDTRSLAYKGKPIISLELLEDLADPGPEGSWVIWKVGKNGYLRTLSHEDFPEEKP